MTSERLQELIAAGECPEVETRAVKMGPCETLR
jgi:hypothetical protein